MCILVLCLSLVMSSTSSQNYRQYSWVWWPPPPPPTHTHTHTTRSHSRDISKSSLSEKIFATHTPQHYKESFKRCCWKQSVLKDPSPTGEHTTRSHSSNVAQSTLYLKIIGTQNNQRLNQRPPPFTLWWTGQVHLCLPRGPGLLASPGHNTVQIISARGTATRPSIM